MLQIQSGAERASKRAAVKGCILGPSGIGKTSLLRTLDPKTTLFIDLEAGDLAVADWPGDRLDVFKEAQRLELPVWEMVRHIACWVGGPSPLAMSEDQPYSKAHYKHVCDLFGDPASLAKYETLFIDSITVASRSCFTWAQTQPAAFSEKTGKPDTRGAYGLLKQDMVSCLTQLQHADRSVWMVGILDKTTDDFNRTVWKPQIEGGGTVNALPGIFDQLVSMVEIADNAGGPKFRAFVCHTLNEWGYPAKDRSRCLDVLEPPDLGALMAKIGRGAGAATLDLSMPAGSAAASVPKA